MVVRGVRLKNFVSHPRVLEAGALTQRLWYSWHDRDARRTTLARSADFCADFGHRGTGLPGPWLPYSLRRRQPAVGQFTGRLPAANVGGPGGHPCERTSGDLRRAGPTRPGSRAERFESSTFDQADDPSSQICSVCKACPGIP